MMERLSIRTQFIWSFVLIIILSLIATLLTGFGALVLWQRLGTARPANYYEQQIPMIEQVVNEQGARLLDPQARNALEQVIPPEGIQYQVLDSQATPLYGTLSDVVVANGADLVRGLNSNLHQNGAFIHLLPILDQQGKLSGAVALRYRLRVSAAPPWHQLWLTLTLVAVVLSPFLYVTAFTVVMARRFGRRLNQPIQAMISAAQRIRERDLDFAITYQNNNEIGQLARAFEQMRAALQESLTREWRSEQARQEMVAAIAHDLGTPLTIIRGHTESLLEGSKDHPERLERYLLSIAQNSERAVKLVQEMRHAVAIEQPDFHLCPFPVDPLLFLEHKAAGFDALLAPKQITLKRETVDRRAQPHPLTLDADRLAEIVDNLMANAIRFTPVGGIITWHTVIEDAALTIRITDTGPGFDDHSLPFIFDKFYRADPSRSRGEQHSGMGLFIAKTLVEKHGGSVTARNAASGAEVEFTVKSLQV